MAEREDETHRQRMENEFLRMQRPCSPRRSRSRALRVDLGGEGQLSDPLDVFDPSRAQVECLPVAATGLESDGDCCPPNRARHLGERRGCRVPADMQVITADEMSTSVTATIGATTACVVGLIAYPMRESS